MMISISLVALCSLFISSSCSVSMLHAEAAATVSRRTRRQNSHSRPTSSASAKQRILPHGKGKGKGGMSRDDYNYAPDGDYYGGYGYSDDYEYDATKADEAAVDGANIDYDLIDATNATNLEAFPQPDRPGPDGVVVGADVEPTTPVTDDATNHEAFAPPELPGPDGVVVAADVEPITPVTDAPTTQTEESIAASSSPPPSVDSNPDEVDDVPHISKPPVASNTSSVGSPPTHLPPGALADPGGIGGIVVAPTPPSEAKPDGFGDSPASPTMAPSRNETALANGAASGSPVTEETSTIAPGDDEEDDSTESPPSNGEDETPGTNTLPPSELIPTDQPNQGDEETTIDFDTAPSLTAEYCDGVSADKTANVTWVYAVEFRPGMSEEEIAEAMSMVELKLVSELMTCNEPMRRLFRHRKMLADGVAGLDYMPRDKKQGDVMCFSNSSLGGTCDTYNGRMQLYLEKSVNGQNIINELLINIQSVMEKADFPTVAGIVKVWYLSPEMNAVAEANADNLPGNNGQANIIESSYSKTGIVVSFSLLGFVFVALMFGMFRKRDNGGDASLTIDPSAITIASESSATKPSISPFSAMLPQAYSLHDPETMSAILEGDSDAESRAQSSVIVSDGGFTTDGDSLVDDSMYTSSNIHPVLGAQKVDEDNVDDDRIFLFENDGEEVSSIDKPRTPKDFLAVKRDGETP